MNLKSFGLVIINSCMKALPRGSMSMIIPTLGPNVFKRYLHTLVYLGPRGYKGKGDLGDQGLRACSQTSFQFPCIHFSTPLKTFEDKNTARPVILFASVLPSVQTNSCMKTLKRSKIQETGEPLNSN